MSEEKIEGLEEYNEITTLLNLAAKKVASLTLLNDTTLSNLHKEVSALLYTELDVVSELMGKIQGKDLVDKDAQFERVRVFNLTLSTRFGQMRARLSGLAQIIPDE